MQNVYTINRSILVVIFVLCCLDSYGASRQNARDRLAEKFREQKAAQDAIKQSIDREDPKALDRALRNKLADPNKTAEHIQTPLVKVIFDCDDVVKRREMVKILLKYRADPNIPIHLVPHGSKEWRENLGFYPLHAAVSCQDPEVVKMLLANNARVNVLTESMIAQKDDPTKICAAPLHFACGPGVPLNFAIVRMLVESGAQINVRAQGTGNTPLHLAVCNGNLQGRRNMHAKYICLIAVALTAPIHVISYSIDPHNAFEELISLKLIHPHIPLRLHLGCGEQHFAGYINIDYPASNHTTQTTQVADVFANIVELNFPTASIDEVRNHHFFEHFDRSMALALLCRWHSWLKPGGKIIIETPDFFACLDILHQGRLSYIQQQVVLRHIFGSHEAFWAYHYDGWYEEKFRHILSLLGFEQISVQRYAHPGYELVPNIIVQAVKGRAVFTYEDYLERATTILRESLVNNSEHLMLKTWVDNFKKAFSHPAKTIR